MKKSILFFGLILLFSSVSKLTAGAFVDDEEKTEGLIIVANKSGDNVSFIEPESGNTIKILPTGYAPHEVEVSDDGNIAVVSNYGDRKNPGNSLSVYDLKTQSLEKTIDLG